MPANVLLNLFSYEIVAVRIAPRVDSPIRIPLCRSRGFASHSVDSEGFAASKKIWSRDQIRIKQDPQGCCVRQVYL